MTENEFDVVRHLGILCHKIIFSLILKLIFKDIPKYFSNALKKVSELLSRLIKLNVCSLIENASK